MSDTVVIEEGGAGQKVIEHRTPKSETEGPRNQTEQVRAGMAFSYLVVTVVLGILTLLVGRFAVTVGLVVVALLVLWYVGFRLVGVPVPTIVTTMAALFLFSTWYNEEWTLPGPRTTALVWAMGGLLFIWAPELLALFRFASEVVDQHPRSAIRWPATLWPWTPVERVLQQEEAEPSPPPPPEPQQPSDELRVVPYNHSKAKGKLGGLTVKRGDLINFIRQWEIGPTYRGSWERFWTGTDGYERWRNVVDTLEIIGVVAERQQGKATEWAVGSKEEAMQLLIDSRILERNGQKTTT
jgi:hypothetical protein